MARRERPKQWRRDEPRKHWLVPFWFVVTGSVLMAVVLAAGGMFVPINYFSTDLRDQTVDSCSSAVTLGNKLLADLVYNEVTDTSYVSLLHSIEFNVMGFVMEPAYSAVGALVGSMRTQHRSEGGWTGNEEFAERVELSRFAWASLEPQWLDTLGTQMNGFGTQIVNNWRKARTENVKIGFAAGQQIGVSFHTDNPDFCEGTICESACWKVDNVYKGPSIHIVKVPPGNAGLLTCRDQCVSYDSCKYWSLMTETGDCYLKNVQGEVGWQSNVVSGIKDCIPQPEKIGSIGYVSEGSSMFFWNVDSETGTPEQMIPFQIEAQNWTEDAWYSVQTQLAQQGRPLTRAWSEIFFWNTHLAIAWTAPIAYCGNYDCMQGVVSAHMRLGGVSYDAFTLWLTIRDKLAQPPYQFPIGAGNSSIFIVSREARRSPGQEGLLIGCSEGCPGRPGVEAFREMHYADNFSNPAVSATSRAILERFGSWSNESLEDHQMFTFRPGSADEIFRPGTYCNRPFDQVTQGGECWQAGTISVRLDEDTAWLVVLVLPAAAFAQKSSEVAASASSQVEVVMDSSDSMVTDARQWTAWVAIAVLLLSACLSTCLGFHVSSRLQELAVLTQRLSNLDFTQCEIKRGCSISDVTNLQQAFCRLILGIEAFARFVPEPVVRSLVHGQDIKMEQRQVTILCSDIANFTKISEDLHPMQLLYLLTRYLSVMHRIVHRYKGVVAEVLGDGLLIYWNTPDDVEKHAELACAAALLMQQHVMDLLNQEFTEVNLPYLEIRIGIHTEWVLSGTTGSEMKKKFGCLGKGVDIADHLEGLCKVHRLSTLVSGSTLKALSPDSGFNYQWVCAEQMDGEDEPLQIYELTSRDWSPRESKPEADATTPGPAGSEDLVVSSVSGADSPEQQRSPGGLAGMNPVMSRRSTASRSSFCRELSLASAVEASMSRRSTGRDAASALEAVADSGSALQRNCDDLFASSEPMRRFLSSSMSL